MIRDLLLAASGVSGGGGGGETDPYWDNVELLINMDEAPGNPIIDYSKYKRPVTYSGTVTTTEDVLFDSKAVMRVTSGTGSINLSSADAPKLGSGSFTIEFFLRMGNISNVAGVIDSREDTSRAGKFALGAASNLMIIQTAVSNTGFSAPASSEFVHVAFVREAGSIKAYTNGSSRMTLADSSNIDTTATFSIGKWKSASNAGTNYLAGLRITKGIARYTAPFVPPTKRFPVMEVIP